MSLLFKRKQQAGKVPEASLLGPDDPMQTSTGQGVPGVTQASNHSTWPTAPDAPPHETGLVSPSINPASVASPRISTSSRTSIFERSVDATPLDNASGMALVDPSHSQLVIDNQIPSVLDASVEAITSNADLSQVEIVTAQPHDTTNNNNNNTLAVPALPMPWSETLSSVHDPEDAAAKRLSFVSYTDLLGVEQAEAEAASLHSQKHATSPAALSPESTGAAVAPPQGVQSPSRPGSSTPGSIVLDPASGGSGGHVMMATRRQKSIMTLGQPADLELTRSTMAETILEPAQLFDHANPWA